MKGLGSWVVPFQKNIKNISLFEVKYKKGPSCYWMNEEGRSSQIIRNY
jgi:hypothetical protein